MQRKLKTGSKDNSALNNALILALEHFDRMLARCRWLGAAHGAKIRAFTDQWIPSHFGYIVLGSLKGKLRT